MPGKLTTKQQLFVEAYLGAARGNATEAARLAGYAGTDETLRAIGYENLTKPHIAEAVGIRLQTAKDAMGADEVLALLTDHARGTIEDFFDVDGASAALNLTKAKASGRLHLIRKISFNEFGPVLELYSAQSALELLGKKHKLFVSRHEHTGANGGPIEVSDAARRLEAVRRMFDKQVSSGLSLAEARQALVDLGVDADDLDAVHRELALSEDDGSSVPAR